MPEFLKQPNIQIALAMVLGAAGVYLLLPRPRGRSTPLGVFLTMASVAVLAVFLATRFGRPLGTTVGDLLFWLFAAVALIFGTILVTQRNPARGAIAFAFVILSTCGLFLLLAAPFLMAATIIIYAGAIIVTFLFVLMLSNQAGPSDENDRTREPLLGSLAGFAFVGLILLTLHQSTDAALPVEPLTSAERVHLSSAIQSLDQALVSQDLGQVKGHVRDAHTRLTAVVGDSTPNQKNVASRHAVLKQSNSDSSSRPAELLSATRQLQRLNVEVDDNVEFAESLTAAHAECKKLRESAVLYSGHGQLPARNVANIGYLLYSEHLLAVELAGTLLLVATIGAVAIAQRRPRSLA